MDQENNNAKLGGYFEFYRHINIGPAYIGNGVLRRIIIGVHRASAEQEWKWQGGPGCESAAEPPTPSTRLPPNSLHTKTYFLANN